MVRLVHVTTSCLIPSCSSSASSPWRASSCSRSASGGRSTADTATNLKVTTFHSHRPSAVTTAEALPTGALGIFPAWAAVVPTDTPVRSYVVVGVISRPIATSSSWFTLAVWADASEFPPNARIGSISPHGNIRRRYRGRRVATAIDRDENTGRAFRARFPHSMTTRRA